MIIIVAIVVVVVVVIIIIIKAEVLYTLLKGSIRRCQRKLKKTIELALCSLLRSRLSGYHATRCVTSLKTAAKETRHCVNFVNHLLRECSSLCLT